MRKGLDKIHILAKGPMWWKCPQKVSDNEEIWGLNGTYLQNPADRLFIMHDLLYHLQIEDANGVENLNKLGIPIYTPVAYPFFDNNIVYPINEIIEYHGTPWFSNVICYILALAIMQEPKEINLWGVSMMGDEYFKERPAVLYWCGVAQGRGIQVNAPHESNLFTPEPDETLMYGYRIRRSEQGIVHAQPKLSVGKIARKYKWVPEGEEFEIDDTPIEIFKLSRGIT